MRSTRSKKNLNTGGSLLQNNFQFINLIRSQAITHSHRRRRENYPGGPTEERNVHSGGSTSLQFNKFRLRPYGLKHQNSHKPAWHINTQEWEVLPDIINPLLVG
jgi:hypothetical protein